MPKFTPDDVLDVLPNEYAKATRQYVLSGQPLVYADIAALTLAQIDLTAGAGNGDFTVGNGDTSGRKVTVAQQADVPISASGDASHVALADVTGTRLLAVTTCPLQALTSGGTVTIPAWDAEVGDPT